MNNALTYLIVSLRNLVAVLASRHRERLLEANTKVADQLDKVNTTYVSGIRNNRTVYEEAFAAADKAKAESDIRVLDKSTKARAGIRAELTERNTSISKISGI